jgi:hypothetical protein
MRLPAGVQLGSVDDHRNHLPPDQVFGRGSVEGADLATQELIGFDGVRRQLHARRARLIPSRHTLEGSLATVPDRHARKTSEDNARCRQRSPRVMSS